MFFKRRAHPLPKFPPKLIPTFRKLCVAIAQDEIPALQHRMEEMFVEDREENRDNPLYDARLSRHIEDRCRLLLHMYGEVSTRHRALILGAVRYCVATGDAMPDEHFATGKEDDARILNHVLEEIGITDQFIELDRG